jgi:hypothetical protein
MTISDEDLDEIRFRLACWETFEPEPEEAHDDLHKLLDAFDQERAKVARLRAALINLRQLQPTDLVDIRRWVFDAVEAGKEEAR